MNVICVKNFEIYNVHVESAEIERWSIHSKNVDYVEYNRKHSYKQSEI